MNQSLLSERKIRECLSSDELTYGKSHSKDTHKWFSRAYSGSAIKAVTDPQKASRILDLKNRITHYHQFREMLASLMLLRRICKSISIRTSDLQLMISTRLCILLNLTWLEKKVSF